MNPPQPFKPATRPPQKMLSDQVRAFAADAHGNTGPPETAWRIEIERRIADGAHRTGLLEQRQQLTEQKHAEALLGIHEQIGTIQIQNQSLATKNEIRELVQLQWVMAGFSVACLLIVIFYAAVHK